MAIHQTNDRVSTDDVAAIINKAKLRGRPMMSTMVREKDGTQVYFKKDEKGRVRVVERFNPNE